MYKSLFVTHGLTSNQDELTLHPDLFLYQPLLAKRKQQWFQTSSYNPLALYAAILDVEPTSLLASKLPENTAKQYWIASPYHAQLMRDSVRVMSEGMLPWCEEDAAWVCELLNPLLAEDAMRLYAIDSALLLACAKPLDAWPAVFANIAGKHLPNRHPKGVDGGYLMRLMAEVQMLFKQSPAPHRRQRGEVDVHGLWFWGACEPCDSEMPPAIAVASRDPFLRAVVDGKDAVMIITESEQLSEFIKQGSDLPKQVLLFGENHAVLLKKPLLPKFTSSNWSPKAAKEESDLFSIL
ncbi:MAG: threonine synthase [Mariprofundaceae bacterium]|nr:threonine synthase [Mariprofundaceae bacterium]